MWAALGMVMRLWMAPEGARAEYEGPIRDDAAAQMTKLLLEAAREQRLRQTPFEDLDAVPLDRFIEALEGEARALELEPVLRSEYEELATLHGLARSEASYREFVRVRMLFEATRDGGWWHLRWTITNREPNSENIWAQWARATVPTDDARGVTAHAECDELSALFAFLAYRLGVARVGLFWPTGNHVVAVWTTEGPQGKPVRIVVPTSQIFLDDRATLGTRGFDPRTQRTIFTYRRADVRAHHRLPVKLARFFIEAIRRHGHLPAGKLQTQRNERSRHLGGS